MTASMFASSSRIVLDSITAATARRTVVHHARPARQPILRAPQTPKPRLPTAGTSDPAPTASADLASTSSGSGASLRSSQLKGTNYTLYHSPPPSAPSYTTGVMPPFLQWCKGNSISLTGEEQARKRRERKAEIEGGLGWDAAMLDKMRQLRTEGKSRREIGEALSIPFEHHHLIARAAPQTSDQLRAQDEKLQQLKSTWGYRKRLARGMRLKRKEFW